MQVRRTVRDLRRHNRSVVGELIDEGLVVEAGLVDSDGDRPRTLLRVNPGYTYVAPGAAPGRSPSLRLDAPA